MIRAAHPRAIDLSDRVRQLIDAEAGDEAAVARLLRPFARAGFTGLKLDSSGRQLLLVAPRYRVKIRLDPDPAPVTAALTRHVPTVRAMDHWTRFTWAAYDMNGVATAAQALAPHRPDESGTMPATQNPYRDVERATLVGLVALYARPFTGRAGLGAKWWPEDEEELALHKSLMEARRHIYVHADHTAYRAIWHAPGERPVLTEIALIAEVLVKIASMCLTQAARFDAEANRLYPEFEGVLVPSGSQSPLFDASEEDRRPGS